MSLTKKKTITKIMIIAILLTAAAILSSASANGASAKTIKISNAANTSEGIFLEWQHSKKANCYAVLRRIKKHKNWTRLNVTKNNVVLTYHDTKKLKNMRKYEYAVAMLKSQGAAKKIKISKNDRNIQMIIRVTAPSLKAAKTKHSNTVRMKWKKVSKADGYEIQYSGDPLQISPQTAVIKGGKKSSAVLHSKKKAKEFYVRIRTLKKIGKTRYHSDWSYSHNYKNKIRYKIRFYNRRGVINNYRRGGSLSSYDTFQGSCAIGKYSYHVLNNVPKNLCKLIKVDMRTGRVMKVGKKSFKGHGNDLTYNPHKKYIVSTYYDDLKNSDKVVLLNPHTLNPIKVKKIMIPANIDGTNPKKNVKKDVKGITAISYIESNKKYIGRVKTSNNYIMMDSEFRVTRYIKTNKTNKMLPQGIFTTRNLIINVKSPANHGKGYNVGMVFDWLGNYLTTVNFNKNNEIESVYIGYDGLYGGVFVPSAKEQYKKLRRRVRDPKTGKTKIVTTRIRVARSGKANYLFRILPY